MRSRESGFTLIELAIVLVIIGIILGMVIKGKSLVQSAEAKRTAAHARKVETWIWDFYSRYNRFPGDCNGDRIIDAVVQNRTGRVDNSPDTGFCTIGTRDTDPDRPYAELKAAGIPEESNDNNLLAQLPSGGWVYIGYATSSARVPYNAIALVNITCLEAKNLDSTIDGQLDSGKGRIRLMTGNGRFNENSDGNTPWPNCTSEDQRVNVVYLFDKAP